MADGCISGRHGEGDDDYVAGVSVPGSAGVPPAPASAGASPASAPAAKADETSSFLGSASPERPEWRSRGYLPHRDAYGLIQMVTFRLADSLPAAVLEGFRDTLAAATDADRRERAEAYLDAGYGACHLRDATVARMVEASLLHFDGERYRLLAWSIMPMEFRALAQCCARTRNSSGRGSLGRHLRRMGFPL
jgi:hypothetical protein